MLPGGQGAGGVLVLSGTGVGGGSLVYANTLYEPLEDFYVDPQWRDIADWRSELAPHYERAKRMLGVTLYPRETVADRAVRAHPAASASWYGRRRLAATPGHGAPNPSSIPAGNEATRLLAEELHGIPGGAITEVFNRPVTAHILGGAVIGASPELGVIDAYHRVFGHAGLHVVDGSAVSANLGVNPALTITAQAERAMSFWPNNGDPDPRPSLGMTADPTP